MDFHEPTDSDVKVTLKLWRTSLKMLLRALLHPGTKICGDFYDWDWEKDGDKFLKDSEGKKVKRHFITEQNIPQKIEKIVKQMAKQLGIERALEMRQASDAKIKKEMK